MPRQKKLEAYPPTFEGVLRRACEDTVVIHCLSTAEARNLRNHLYTYRKSLYLESDDQAFILLAANLFFSQKENVLTIQRRRGASQILSQVLQDRKELQIKLAIDLPFDQALEPLPS